MVQQNHNMVQQCVWPPRACLHTLQHLGMLPMGRQMVSSQTLITASVRSPHSAENSKRIQKEPGLTAPTDGLSLGLRITDIQQKSRYPTWWRVPGSSSHAIACPDPVVLHLMKRTWGGEGGGAGEAAKATSRAAWDSSGLWTPVEDVSLCQP